MWTALHTIVSVPVAFLANAVVARSLGVSEYGYLAYLTMAFALATQVANGGFSASLVQWGAAAEASGDRRMADGLLRRSLGFHLVIELPILVLAVFMLVGGENVLLVGALVLSSVLTCLFGGSTLALTIESRSAAAAKLAIVSNLGVQLTVVVVALTAPDPVAVLAARLLAAAAFVPAHLILLGPERRRTVLRLRLPRGLPRGFWAFAGQSFLAGLLGALVFSRSEIFLLSWLSTAEAAGLFALAFGLSYQLTAPVDAMLNPLLPAVAGVVSAHPHLANRALLRATRFAALLASVITGVLLPMVYVAMPLIYGTEFTSAAAVLLPLALVSCLQSLCQPVTAFIYARQQGRLLLRSHAVALGVNVAVALALIPAYGVWGAVVANIAGQTASLVALVGHELRTQRLGLRAFLAATRLWWLSCLTGTGTIGVVWWISSQGGPVWPGLLVAPVVGGGLLLGAARLTKSGILASDRGPLLDALPRRVRGAASFMTLPFTTDLSPAPPSRPAEEPDKVPTPREGIPDE